MSKLMHRFCDLPKGTRYRYPDSEESWVVIEAFRDGLVAKYIDPKTIIKGERNPWQSLCSFCDENWTLESEVEVII